MKRIVVLSRAVKVILKRIWIWILNSELLKTDSTILREAIFLQTKLWILVGAVVFLNLGLATKYGISQEKNSHVMSKTLDITWLFLWRSVAAVFWTLEICCALWNQLFNKYHSNKISGECDLYHSNWTPSWLITGALLGTVLSLLETFPSKCKY